MSVKKDICTLPLCSSIVLHTGCSQNLRKDLEDSLPLVVVLEVVTGTDRPDLEDEQCLWKYYKLLCGRGYLYILHRDKTLL